MKFFNADASHDLINLVASGDKIDAITLLNVPGCDVNYHDDNDRYALSEAVRRNDMEMVRLLMKHGATIPEGPIARADLFGLAKFHKNQEMIQLLSETENKLTNGR